MLDVLYLFSQNSQLTVETMITQKAKRLVIYCYSMEEYTVDFGTANTNFIQSVRLKCEISSFWSSGSLYMVSTEKVEIICLQLTQCNLTHIFTSTRVFWRCIHKRY